jgi:hypothetical protein
MTVIAPASISVRVPGMRVDCAAPFIDLDHCAAQLMAGKSRTLPHHGLAVFMFDVDRPRSTHHYQGSIVALPRMVLL